jgi:hypothetical protein
MNWTGKAVPEDCGQVIYNGKMWRTNRFFYYFVIQPIPEGLVVCHKCDNPICCNPDHLFIGTVADNNSDKMKKGRWKGGRKIGTGAGEKNPNSKLIIQQVLEIRKKINNGYTIRQLAEEYDVSFQTISSIVNKETWSCI